MLLFAILTLQKEYLDDVKSVEMYSNYDLLLAVNFLLKNSDSKNFVDRPTKRPLKSIVKDFMVLKKELKLDQLLQEQLENMFLSSEPHKFNILKNQKLWNTQVDKHLLGKGGEEKEFGENNEKTIIDFIENSSKTTDNKEDSDSKGDKLESLEICEEDFEYPSKENGLESIQRGDDYSRTSTRGNKIGLQKNVKSKSSNSHLKHPLINSVKKKHAIESLQAFIDLNFYPPGFDLAPQPLKDYNSNPDFLKYLNSQNLIDLGRSLHSRWPDLSRVRIELPSGSTSTLLNLPYPFFIPGGRFREFYYWDTYWILEGLVISNLFESASNVIKNISYVIGKLGYFPNGTRMYYQSRSQPPFFPQMLLKLLDLNGGYLNDFILNEGLENALKEYEFFEKFRSVQVIVGGEKHKLSVFHVDTNFPRPESFAEDVLTYEEYKRDLESAKTSTHTNSGNNTNSNSGEVGDRERSGLTDHLKSDDEDDFKRSGSTGRPINDLKRNGQNIPPENDEYDLKRNGQNIPPENDEDMEFLQNNGSTFPLPENISSLGNSQFDMKSQIHNKTAPLLFSNLKSAAESGWDFSTRWLQNDHSLSSMEAFYQIPVDLNAIMYRNELIIAGLLRRKGDVKRSEEFLQKSASREKAINAVLWNKNEKVWMDYVTTTKNFVDSRFYFSNITPLVYGIRIPDHNVSEFDILLKYSKELFGYKGGVPASGEGKKHNSRSLSDSENEEMVFGKNPLEALNPLLNNPNSQNSSESTIAKRNRNKKTTSSFDDEEEPVNQQWDFPNAWAPHQHMLTEYLLHIGEDKMALHVGRSFMAGILIAFENEGEFFEKYDVTKIGNTGGGGEYEPQTGFGWTNGTALSFLQTFGDRLVKNYSHQKSYNKILETLKQKIAFRKSNSLDMLDNSDDEVVHHEKSSINSSIPIIGNLRESSKPLF